tara:strand:+ start:3943 stop:5238 length:1296 start_codon:yes stop_codon:yes gene_type:complete
MAAITFPNNPSAGDEHTINGISYTFTDGTWVAIGQSNNYSLPIASPTTLGGIKGGGTDITVANDGVISFSGTLPGPKTFTFTATSDGNNGYTVTGNDRRGIVSGTNPTIHINEEDTIIFNVNSGPFHVLWAHGINYSTSQVGSGGGVNTASGNGTSNGSVTWVTAVNDGLSLYQGGAQFFYQDSNQDFANNPTTYKYGTINVYLKDTPEGKGDWLELNDTPNSFSGQAGKFTKVNSTEDGLEFTNSPVSGDFTGATSGADGTAGLVIKPSAGDEGKYLKGDGSWDTVTSGSTTTINNNADYRIITGSATSDTLNAESNLTFNSSGVFQVTGEAIIDAISINANYIQLYSGDADLYIKGYGTGGAYHLTLDDHVTVAGDITVKMGLKDKDSQLGTNGQVLTSTGTQVDWVDASSISTSSAVPAFQSNWRIPL